MLLEPLMDVEVWTPDDVLGDVMGDLSSRRGQILGTEPDGRLTKVRAIVPRPSSTSTRPRCIPSPTAGAPTGRSSTAMPRRRRRWRREVAAENQKEGKEQREHAGV